MKKLYISLGILAAGAGLVSCNPDKSPQLDLNKNYTFILDTPAYADQTIDLSEQGTLTFTTAGPQYDLNLQKNYGIEISLTENFESLYPNAEPDANGNVPPANVALTLESQTDGELVVLMSNMAKAINRMYGIFTEEDYEAIGDYQGPVYVRATSYLGAGVAAEESFVTSSVIKLADVISYADFSGEDVSFMYCPGADGNWNLNYNMLASYDGGTDGVYYHGFVHIGGTFKFTKDWSIPGDYGAGDNPVIFNSDETITLTLHEHGSNYNEDGTIEGGLYWAVMKITNPNTANDGEVAGTVTLTPITSVAISGDFNGWAVSLNDATQMDNDGNFESYSANVNVTSGGWKFIFNNDYLLANTNGWSINLGGDIDNLTLDGPNITLEGSKVTIDLVHYPWTCTVE